MAIGLHRSSPARHCPGKLNARLTDAAVYASRADLTTKRRRRPIRRCSGPEKINDLGWSPFRPEVWPRRRHATVPTLRG